MRLNINKFSLSCKKAEELFVRGGKAGGAGCGKLLLRAVSPEHGDAEHPRTEGDLSIRFAVADEGALRRRDAESKRRVLREGGIGLAGEAARIAPDEIEEPFGEELPDAALRCILRLVGDDAELQAPRLEGGERFYLSLVEAGVLLRVAGEMLAEVFVTGLKLLRPVRNGALHELPGAVADEAGGLLGRDEREGEGGERLVDVIDDVTQRIQKGAVEIKKYCFEHDFS